MDKFGDVTPDTLDKFFDACLSKTHVIAYIYENSSTHLVLEHSLTTSPSPQLQTIRRSFFRIFLSPYFSPICEY